jgi:hypothetical protein
LLHGRCNTLLGTARTDPRYCFALAFRGVAGRTRRLLPCSNMSRSGPTTKLGSAWPLSLTPIRGPSAMAISRMAPTRAIPCPALGQRLKRAAAEHCAGFKQTRQTAECGSPHSRGDEIGRRSRLQPAKTGKKRRCGGSKHTCPRPFGMGYRSSRHEITTAGFAVSK